MNKYIKWFFIVLANASYGVVLGLDEGASVLGMLLGVFTWVFIYIALDSYLLNMGLTELSKSLMISAFLRIFLQLFSYVDIYSGLFAVRTVDELLFKDVKLSIHLLSYLYTVFTGFYLSVVCAFIMFFISMGSALILRENKRLKWKV